jgi:hypothetical protein
MDFNRPNASSAGSESEANAFGTVMVPRVQNGCERQQASVSLTENSELVSAHLTRNLLLKSFSNRHLPRTYYSDTSISTRLCDLLIAVRLSAL